MPRGLCTTCTLGGTSVCPIRGTVPGPADSHVVTWCERHIGIESPSIAAQRANTALAERRQISAPGHQEVSRASWTPRD